MAPRSEDQKNGAESQPVIDPAAEKPTKTPRARGGAGKQPTGKDEERFYEDAGEEYKLQHRQQDLGWLGKFFGGSNSAPTNIAGLVIVFCFLALFITTVVTVKPEDAQRLSDIQKVIFGLIGSAMSFIFGAATKK